MDMSAPFAGDGKNRSLCIECLAVAKLAKTSLMFIAFQYSSITARTPRLGDRMAAFQLVASTHSPSFSATHISVLMASFRVEEGGFDGALTFDEACGQVNGMKLQGPERRPMRSDRATGDVDIGSLPVRQLESSNNKLEQFADVIMHHPLNVTTAVFDNLYKFMCEGKFSQLPFPFSLKKEPSVPYTLQIIIQSAAPPPEGDPNGAYVHIFKHIYLHRNKVSASDCVQMCYGNPLRFDWGNQSRVALMALNFMLDKMGGKQARYWLIKPKYEKKVSLDQQAREDGYKFIREFGPRTNNRNQFMEWTDEQINTPGGKIEGWSEGKVKEALRNHMRGRQNAKTLDYWPFTFKSFSTWFFDNVLVKMLPSMRQRAITWIGRTRAGKSLGSKTVLFMQSKYEIDLADRNDLVPSIVTAKHLDFFKAEPLTRFKPGVFDDGMLQRMDSSFLKAFLNPSAPRMFSVKVRTQYFHFLLMFVLQEFMTKFFLAI